MIDFIKKLDYYKVLYDEEYVGDIRMNSNKVWIVVFYDEFGNIELTSRDLKLIINKLDELNGN